MAPFFLHGESPRPVPQWRNPSPYAIGPADPHWDKVVLYLPLTGTNGQSTFTDVSSYGHAVTRNGNAVISTAQAPALSGVGSSALLDGNGDFLGLADNDRWDPGSGDFTTEFFFYVRSYGKLQFGAYRQQLIGNYAGASEGWSLLLSGTASTYTQLSVGTGDTGIIAANFSIQLNTWYYYAWVKSGANNTIYINASPVGTGTQSVIFPSTGTLNIGRNNAASAWDFDGHFSHIRLTKGIARPVLMPTVPFPIG